MKTFAIINGKELFIRQFENKETAIEWAENHLDCSKEIILREINSLDMKVKDIKNFNIIN